MRAISEAYLMGLEEGLKPHEAMGQGTHCVLMISTVRALIAEIRRSRKEIERLKGQESRTVYVHTKSDTDKIFTLLIEKEELKKEIERLKVKLELIQCSDVSKGSAFAWDGPVTDKLIDSLETLIGRESGSITFLNEDALKLVGEIARLKSSMPIPCAWGVDYEVTKNRCKKLEAENAKLRERLNAIADENSSYQKEVWQLKEENAKLRERYEQLKKNIGISIPCDPLQIDADAKTNEVLIEWRRLRAIEEAARELLEHHDTLWAAGPLRELLEKEKPDGE